MCRLSVKDREEYNQKADAMRERGVRVGDVLVCDEGARPKRHECTGKFHVRIMEYCIIDDTGPRFFIHGFRRGLVAYVSDEVILPGTKFRVMRKFEHSVVLEPVDAK